MPPLLAHDPLAVVPAAASRWADLARALLDASCEAWVLALVALAVYSFLERDVRSVLSAALPLFAALAAASGLAAGVRVLGGVPRPLDEAGPVLGTLLLRAYPSAQVAAAAAFATYTAFAYRRRGTAVVVVAAAAGAARALAGPHGLARLLAGGLLGAVLAGCAYAAALRWLPRGPLERVRRSASP